jgi:membrane associated rhomboid family serine protease
MNTNKDPLNYPICSFFAVLITIIFSLYFTNALKTIPCEKDMKSVFISQFIHTEFLHLISNLYGIYSLSRIEIKIGPKKFFSLIIFLLIFTSILESILHQLIETPCSIGFSGILYGVFTFEIMAIKDDFDYNLLIAIVADTISQKMMKNKISLYGHIIGVLSGILGGFIFKKLNIV